MNRPLLALLCLLSLPAVAQTTITLYPNVNGLDSNGSLFGIIQNNLAVGTLTSFYFYEYIYETGVGYDYSHFIVGSVGNADWTSKLGVDPITGYKTLHAEWSGNDNQGVYPGVPVPGHFAVDASYTAYTKCGGSGRGGGYCHYIINWMSMLVTITE